jgi:putative methyltransferase
VTGEFQAIIETNRGCPFLCTFCYWGRGGLTRKYKHYGLERVQRELEWCARHKISYVFNADSNFGMHKRDEEIAGFLVSLKVKTGYPEKFRTCYGKNTNDRIFKIGSMLHAQELDKGITLARQSNDPVVLENIKRGNISMETYQTLQTRFNEADIPIYTELILGLPGETKETWRKAIEDLLNAGLKNQLFIYFCQILPNTDMADPEYRRKFGIETQRIELNEIHSTVRKPSWVSEYEHIVVSTHSMPLADWREMAVLSWMTMLMHSLKLGYFVMEWLFAERGVKRIDFLTHLASGPGNGPIAWLVEDFYAKADRMLKGEGRGCVACGNIYWDVEEAAFIELMREPDSFFADMMSVIDVPQRVIDYQMRRLPMIHMFDGDIDRWARETIIFGRKSGTLLLPEKAA